MVFVVGSLVQLYSLSQYSRVLQHIHVTMLPTSLFGKNNVDTRKKFKNLG